VAGIIPLMPPPSMLRTETRSPKFGGGNGVFNPPLKWLKNTKPNKSNGDIISNSSRKNNRRRV